MSNANIGDRISEIRKKRGLSQEQLAEMAILNRVTVAKYESGKIEPGANALGRLSDALDVSADLLIGREKNPEGNDSEEEIPRTIEAKILARGIDKLPKEQREQAINVMRAMFAQYSRYFELEEENDNDT